MNSNVVFYGLFHLIWIQVWGVVAPFQETNKVFVLTGMLSFLIQIYLFIYSFVYFQPVDTLCVFVCIHSCTYV